MGGIQCTASGGYIQLPWGQGTDVSHVHMELCFIVTLGTLDDELIVFNSGNSLNDKRYYFGVREGYWNMGIQGSSWSTTDNVVPATSNTTYTVKIRTSDQYTTMWVDDVQAVQKSFTPYELNHNLRFNGWMDGNGDIDLVHNGDFVVHYFEMRLGYHEIYLRYDFSKDQGTRFANQGGRWTSAEAVLNDGADWVAGDTAQPGGGGYLSFDGKTDVAVSGLPSADLQPPFTIEYMSRPFSRYADDGLGQRVITSDRIQDSTRLAIGYGRNGRVGSYPYYYGDVLTAPVWQRVSVSHDGTTLKMYEDGELKVSEAVTINPEAEGNVAIGGRPVTSDRFFFGDIKDVRFWDHARTQAQVRGLAKRKLSGREKGLMAYYPMDRPLEVESNIGPLGTVPSPVPHRGRDYGEFTRVGSPQVVLDSGRYGLEFSADGQCLKRNRVSVGGTSFNRAGATFKVGSRRQGGFRCVIHEAATGDGSVGGTCVWLGVDDQNRIVATIGAKDQVGWAAGATDIIAQPGSVYTVEAYWDLSTVRVFVNGFYKEAYGLDTPLSIDDTFELRLGAASDAGNYQFDGIIYQAWIGYSVNNVRMSFDAQRGVLRDYSNNQRHGKVFGTVFGTE